MFCSKCGQKVTDGNLYCEYCGAKLIIPDNKKEVETINPQISAAGNESIGKTSNKPKMPLIILIIIAAVILITIGGGALVLALRNKPQEMNNELCYFKDFDEADVIFPDDGEAYVDKQLLITVKERATEDEIKKLIKSFGGEIVGFNAVTRTYQVEFAKVSGDKLLDLIDDFENSNYIESASLNYVYYADSIIGSDVKLDNSIMGIADADFDDSLIGEVKISIVGTAIDKSGITSLLPGAKMTGIDMRDRQLVSLYGWENDMTRSAADGCEIFEMASHLTPTYDAGREDVMSALNNDAAYFINSMIDYDFNFVILSSKQSEDDSFLAGIADEQAIGRILSIGAINDPSIASGIDVFAEGGTPEAVEYATSIALMTWVNNPDLAGENIKDILANSFAQPIEEGKPGLLNAIISTEVSRRLKEKMASLGDADEPGKITYEDIIDMIEKVKADLGIVDVPGGEAERTPRELLEERLSALVDEKGYYRIGQEAMNVTSANEELNIYDFADRGAGLLSASIGNYIAGYDDVLLVTYVENDLVNVSLYIVVDGTVELIDDRPIVEYYMTFSDVVPAGNTCGKQYTGVSYRDLKLSNIHFEIDQNEGDIRLKTYECYSDYSADIAEIGGEFYLRVAVDCRMLLLYKITIDGFADERALLWEPYWEYNSSARMQFFMEPMIYDIQSGTAPQLSLSDTDLYSLWGNEGVFFSGKMVEIGCGDVSALIDDIRKFSLPTPLFEFKRINSGNGSYEINVGDNTLLYDPNLVWWRP